MTKITGSPEIGKKIREFRLKAGLTQEKLAEELDIAFQQVQKYERGGTKVNLVRLQQIASILKVPISAFFDEIPQAVFLHTELEVELLNAFRRVQEDHLQKSIVEIVTAIGARDSKR